MEALAAQLEAVSDWITLHITMWVLVGTGILLTVRTRGVQLRRLPDMFRQVVGSRSGAQGGISSFQAFTISLAARVGIGNVFGVAAALILGGPGAIFWMWVTAILGMPIMFGEAVLAQMFRVRNEDGTTFRGGPAYYMRRGLNARVLPILFSVSVILGNGVVYCMVQSNSFFIRSCPVYCSNSSRIFPVFTIRVEVFTVRKTILKCFFRKICRR